MAENASGMTRKIAEFIVTTNAEKIPEEAYAHAKVAFMDWLAVTLGGANDPLVEKLIDHEKKMGGNPQATILGHGVKMNIAQAALINGSASHTLDYDDTLVSFLGHPSVTLFPAVLALCEWKDMSGRDFLNAYLIGLQAGATIGVCAGLDHYMAGWHATATLGHLASAAGCSRLLGLNEQQTIYALGIAGTQASGLKRVFGTMCKPFHAGRASQVGLMAALLAQNGFTSAEDILEGPQGFFEVLKGKVNPDVMALLGLGWDVKNISQKYHASCHATHSPIEAALSLVQQEGISLDAISSISVRSSKLAMDAAGKTSPSTGLEGKFSIPFCVANALVTGITGNQAFTDKNVKNPKIKEIMDRVTVVLDSQKTALEAHVEIKTTDGRAYEAFSDILQAIPSIEIKKDRVYSKFVDLCRPVMNEEKIARAAKEIEKLENTKGMKGFVEAL